MTRETAEHLTCIIDILKLSKKCNKVEIEIGLMHNQRDAENFFDCLLAMVQIETITSIKFTAAYACDRVEHIRGRTSLVFERINWNFIKRRGFGDTKIDHIEKVSVSMILHLEWEEYYSELIYARSDTLSLINFISKLHSKLNILQKC